jgi:hypothetical protein
MSLESAMERLSFADLSKLESEVQFPKRPTEAGKVGHGIRLTANYLQVCSQFL